MNGPRRLLVTVNRDLVNEQVNPAVVAVREFQQNSLGPPQTVPPTTPAIVQPVLGGALNRG